MKTSLACKAVQWKSVNVAETQKHSKIFQHSMLRGMPLDKDKHLNAKADPAASGEGLHVL